MRKPGFLERVVGRLKQRQEPPEQCVLVVRGDGTLIGMYSDAVPWRAIGTIVAMPRASCIEFDVEQQRWIACDERTSGVVAVGISREHVLAAEREHYLRVLRAGAVR